MITKEEWVENSHTRLVMNSLGNIIQIRVFGPNPKLNDPVMIVDMFYDSEGLFLGMVHNNDTDKVNQSDLDSIS